MKKTAFLVLSLAALALASPASAHHSVSAQFDYDKPFDMQATLLKAEWVNPHSYMYFATADAAGKKTEWAIESFSVTGLRNRGINKDVLKVGDKYRIRGFLARNGKPNGFLQSIEFPDGKLYRLWSGDPNGR